MKQILFFLILFTTSFSICAQIVIGDNVTDPSATLKITSTSKGFLPPRMNTVERDAIVVNTTSAGLIIYNTDTDVLNIFDGVIWHAISNNAAATICSSSLTFSEIMHCLQLSYTPQQTLGYATARDILYSIVDIDTNTQTLRCIYTDYSIIMDYSTDPDPSIHAFNLGINAEHIFPQSMGASDEPARSDMFNIFPSRDDVNSARSNFPYYDIDDTDTDLWFYMNLQSSTIPVSNINGYSEKDNDAIYPLLGPTQQSSFEPPEGKKGDLARVIFYFYVIYNADNVNSYLSYADDNFFNTMKPILLQWHANDPVDVNEMERNLKIKSYQGNDNPFVIDPTLAPRLFN
jgi:endonuclease I